MSKIFQIVVKKVQAVASSGAATAIFLEAPKRADSLPNLTVKPSESYQRSEAEILKIVEMGEPDKRSDAYRIPSVSILPADTVSRSHSSTNVGLLLLSETHRNTDLSTVAVRYLAAGTYTWVCPAGVTSVKVECWGGGSGGGTTGATGGGGGGGGGAYARLNAFAVTPGNSYTVVVGSSGLALAGGNSTFNGTSCVAAGGQPGVAGTTSQGAGGAGGTTAASTGDVKFAGGSGGGGGGIGTLNGGGGGGSAGSAANGNAGTSAGVGGSAVTDGGAGGAGASGTTPAGVGAQPGAGGGGASTLGARASGNVGQVRLTYSI